MTRSEQSTTQTDAEVAALSPSASASRAYEPDQDPRADRLSRAGDRVVLGIARHWLALFNIAVFVYLAVPFLAPLFMQVGATGPARLIYTVYMPACHQLPDRSYFLFGEQVVYTLPELEEANVLPGSGLLTRRSYIGDQQLGWKVALCERDVAIYGAVLLGGLLFGLLRRRARIPRLTFKVYLLFLIPVAVDGLTQLFGLRTSNWWLRTVTGAIFGLATVWLAYPYIEDSMDQVRRGVERKLDRR